MIFLAIQVYFKWWKKHGYVIGENYPIHIFLVIISIIFLIIGIYQI